MRLSSTSWLFFVLLGSGFGAVSCKNRDYNSANVQSVGGTIDPMAFNAYYMWSFGKGTPELEYPKDYTDTGKPGDDDYKDNDYTFIDSGEDFFAYMRQSKKTFDLKPDVEAIADGNKLSFQSRGGRVLSMTFTRVDGAKTQLGAAEACKNIKLRLPTVYEIANYCITKTERDSTDGSYKKNRCSGSIWSATKLRQDESFAWAFDAKEGILAHPDRSSTQNVMCVGAAGTGQSIPDGIAPVPATYKCVVWEAGRTFVSKDQCIDAGCKPQFCVMAPQN